MRALFSQRRRNAFTLIELLVVVAIIGLLVSILLPSLKRARDQAKQVMCLSRMKAQYEASSAYADDNNGIFLAGIIQTGPPDYTGPLRSFGEKGLAHQYWLPYLGYQVPLDKAKNAQDVEDRKWSNLFANGAGNIYRFSEKWQARMADAFQSMEVYQCPSFPPIGFAESSRLTTSEMDYVTNAMPNPFVAVNIRNTVPRDLETGPEDIAVGVQVGTTYYWDKRKRDAMKRPADYIYIAEVDESIVKQDLLGGGEQAAKTEGRQGFIFNAIFIAAHIPYAFGPRMDNDIDEGEVRSRHPAGTTAFFFDGHGEAMAYRKIDPGPTKAAAVRLRYFSDVSKLGARWQ